MSSLSDDEFSTQARALQIAAIEATWPPGLRQRLHANAGDHRIYGVWRQTFAGGLFDPLRQFVDPMRAAVDVGALLGQYSLTLAAWATRCLCVEPLEPYAFVARALPDNCVWRTVAAGERAGRATIHTPVAADGGVDFGLSSLVRADWPHATGVRAQATEVQPLDDLIPEALGDNQPIGFVKIDVEGYESHVLRGATRTLARHRPTLLIETADVPALRETMRGLDYRGLFVFRRRLFDLSAFDPAVHLAPEHVWSPERAERFDPDLVMSDPYFVPVERPRR